jgi:hypothetical protein
MPNDITLKILKDHEHVLKTTQNLKDLFKDIDSTEKYIKMGIHLDALGRDLPIHFKYEEGLIAYLFECYLRIIGGREEETGVHDGTNDNIENQKEELIDFFAKHVLTVLQITKEHGHLLNATEYLMRLFATQVKDEASMYVIKQKLTKELAESLEKHTAMESGVFTPLIEKNKTIEARMLDFYLKSSS